MIVFNEEHDILALSEDGEFAFIVEKETIKFASKKARDLNKISQFKDVHNFLQGTGINVGMTAINAYQKTRSFSAKLFAKTPIEKKFYQNLIKDLVSTKKYKSKSRFTDGGIVFEIIKI